MVSIRAVGTLVVAVVVIWITATGRWNRAGWAAPGAISGDVVEIAARLQAAHENGTMPWNLFGHIDRLGAPVGADWSGYPVSDRLEFWLAGLLMPLAGPFGTINWLMLFGYAAGAVSFFLCARFLRWRLPWAFAGALVFAFANFNFRWSPSLSLGLTFTLPPACLLFQWIARGAPAPRPRPWRMLAVGLGLAIGAGNPYFAFMAGQLGLLSGLLQLRRGAHRVRLQTAAWFLAALAAGFALTMAPFFLSLLSGGGTAQTIARNNGGTELYALKPVELFVPPYNHRVEALAKFGTAYERLTMLRGEPWSPYLGVIGGLSFLALAGTAALRAIRLRGRQRIPDAALASGWVLLFSSVGGINCVLGLAGLDVFRATNRYSIFLFAWALFFGLGRLQRRLQPLKFTAWIPALLLVMIGVADQLPSAPRSIFQTAAETLAADRVTADRLAAAASPLASIFQLPAVPFPEVPPRFTFTDYQHFRLYLAHPGLRFSYGGLRGSVADNWGELVARQAPAKMVEELETAGFDLLVVDRRAYAGEADRVVQALESLPLPRVPLPEAPHLAAFRLKPADHPIVPRPDDPRFLSPWNGGPSSATPGPALFAGRGWFASEQDGGHLWRWSGRAAELALWRETSQPADAVMNATLASLTRGHLVIRLNGQVVWEGQTSPDRTTISALSLPLRAGANRVEFAFSGDLRRPKGDQRWLGLKVSDLSITYRR